MDRINRMTLTDQIYEILKDEIIKGSIEGGARLQFTELQKKYNVSSSPLREAMNRLYQDGLVTFFSNKGAQVVTFDESDINEIYDLYCELDCIALRYAFNSLNFDEMIIHLRDNLEKTKQCLSSDGMEKFNQYSDEFHNIIYGHAQNNRLLKMAGQIRSQFSILSSRYEKSLENRQEIFNNHQAIVQCFERKDKAEAIRYIQISFEKSRKYVLEMHKLRKNEVG